VYVISSGKRTKIGELADINTILPGTLGYFTGITESQITIFRITQSLTLLTIYSIDFPKDITPASALYSHTVQTTNIYISAQKEATTPLSVKSVHYRIQIPQAPTALPDHTVYTTIDMLRVVAAFDEVNLVFFRELYPFLSEKWKIAELNQAVSFPKLKSNPVKFFPATITPLYITMNNQIQSVRNETAESPPYPLERILTYGDSGIIYHEPETQELRWHQFSTRTSPQTLLSFVPSLQYELAGQYSTRIGKRVYNCFDFSESLQITLRTCVPQL